MFVSNRNPDSYLSNTKQVFLGGAWVYYIKECVYNVPAVIFTVKDTCCSALKGHIVLASLT